MLFPYSFVLVIGLPAKLDPLGGGIGVKALFDPAIPVINGVGGFPLCISRFEATRQLLLSSI